MELNDQLKAIADRQFPQAKSALDGVLRSIPDEMSDEEAFVQLALHFRGMVDSAADEESKNTCVSMFLMTLAAAVLRLKKAENGC